MKWFKHDTDASIDAKLQELLLDYGASGYGLYWYCVELIAQRVDKSNFTFELEHDARIIARNLNLTIQETTDMMKKMISLGLFSMSKNNKLACYALANRLDQSMTSNKEFRQMIDNYKNSHDKVMTNPDKVMQEEKRREENTLEEIKKELPENLNIDAFNQWCEYKGSKYSKQGKTLSANKLIKYPKDIQQEMVENSIMNGYKGLFEIKKNNNFNSKKPEKGSIAWRMANSSDGEVFDVVVE